MGAAKKCASSLCCCGFPAATRPLRGVRLLQFTLGWAKVGNELSPFKEIDRIGEVGNILIMGRHNEGLPGVAAQLQQQFQNYFAGTFIQVARRLVRQEQDRVMDEGAGDSDALLLAPTEPVGERVEAISQADPIQQVFGAAVALSILASQLDRQGDVFQDRQRGDQIEELEDDADVAAAEERALVFAQGGQFDFAAMRAYKDPPFGGTIDAGDEIEEGALAAAGFPDRQMNCPSANEQSTASSTRFSCPAS